MNDKTAPPSDPKPNNVVSLFDNETVDEFDYDLNDQDLQGFLRVLSYIQNQSPIGECDIKVDFETVTLTVHTTDCSSETDEDIKRYHVFSYKTVVDMYLPMINAALPKEDKEEYVDLLTSALELAIETITLELPDDPEDE